MVEEHLTAPSLDLDQPFADPERALGPADGRTVAIGRGATLILRFFRDIPNGRGPDLRVVEIGDDQSTAWIAVSSDGVTFAEYPAPAISNGTSEYDLADVGVSPVSFVRLRGIDDNGLDPGFDLDAVEALH